MSASEAKVELKPGQVFCRLEVEADAKYQAGFIVIRYYANENNGGRILLSLASLNNRIIEQRSNAPKRRVWSDADVSFLKWMAPKLAQIPYHQQNVNVLKITEHEFETWRNRWADQRSRFIDRYTQEFILPPGCDSPCRQLVDLLPEDGNRVKIALKIEFSDGSTRYPHEILRTIGLGADSSLHRQLASWKPAVSWAQMNRYFSRKSPSLPHSEVVRLLGELLEGHLELVRSGELACVSASEGDNAAEIRFDALPGKFRVSAKFGGSSIGLDAVDGVDKPRIFEKDGKFFIYSHGEKEESGILRRWLAGELNKLRNVQELPDGSLELRASQDNARAIREIWYHLNEQRAVAAVLKRGHDLAPLLDGAGQVQPEIMIGEVGTIGIETKLKWQCGEISLEHQALLQAVATHNELLQDDHGNWLCIDTAYAKEILERIKQEGLPEYDVFPKRDAVRLLNDWQLKNLMRVADASQRIFQEICQLQPFEIPAMPECLSGTLREYQKVACEFLYDRLASNAGCILADDMGLGKTLEVISLMALWKQSHPESSNLGALVICPATLVPHWVAQIHRFAGDVLTCREVIGTGRTLHPVGVGDHPARRYGQGNRV